MITNAKCTAGCPKTKRLQEAKVVEVYVPTNDATCVGRNGVFPVLMVCIECTDGGDARIGFVSRKLRRRVNAGACIPAESMDSLATKWLKMRGLGSPELPEKGEIRDYANKLDSIAKSMLEMLKGM